MEHITSADLEGTADGLELEALSLVQVARMLRAVAADRDALLERLRDCGYPDPRPCERHIPGEIDPD